MSRHTFAGRAGETVALGWDRPLQTFFVHVSKPHPTMIGESMLLDWVGTDTGELPTAIGESMLLDWVGTDTGELPTAAEAIDIAATYADLPSTIGATLETDRLKTLATFDGPAQLAAKPFLRRP